MADKSDPLREMLRTVLAPLIEADGGELYLVSASKKEIKLHLAGSWSGSPATGVAGRRIVEPAVRAVVPKVKVVISSGWRIPDGAERVEA
jgi:Fe-S cluster biogenesis protein NfuA